ncbi:MAG: YggS family pyridoxal phosphate-dependent enzyme [Clostridia bacterium]|nr:YggS family pyridoxal phosphate-dependent enzyme [Clostridia bacterium]
MGVAENYLRVRDDIANTALAVGRRADDVELLAVTKFVDTERIMQAVQAGASHAGENRVQEYVSKAEFFQENGVTCDIIGRLQTNKLKYVTGKVRYIQSVDRLPVAEEINRLAVKLDTVQNILVEVNIGQEEQKGGIMVPQLRDFLYQLSAMQGVCVKGLMCIPPAVSEKEAQGYFSKMRKLFDDISSENIENVKMEQLSMGMSGDYKAAIREGATIVRVGSAIFGQRPTAIG